MMRVVIFCHSLISDWNHGNAHFLRGIVTELLARGHDVITYESLTAWSREQLLANAGSAAIVEFHAAFPHLHPRVVDLERLSLDEALDGTDLVIVHEWNDHPLVERIGRHRAQSGDYVLLFHDTHHRSVSAMEEMSGYDLEHYDGVLAFGEVIRERYLAFGWAQRAWTWHEAADTRVFRPLPAAAPKTGLVWIGNWGDGERTEEIRSYLLEPVRDLALDACVYGVRYSAAARQELASAGVHYGGWLANHKAPHAYARRKVTVHIPRRPYASDLPGIPTIRVFEALACGIPLVSAPWDDTERLFSPGTDYLLARSPEEMRDLLAQVMTDSMLRRSLIERGLAAINARHTCAHRVSQLLDIVADIRNVSPEALMA
jgi:spore maturation protein CgeB